MIETLGESYKNSDDEVGEAAAASNGMCALSTRGVHGGGDEWVGGIVLTFQRIFFTGSGFSWIFRFCNRRVLVSGMLSLC
jgi:hypothetical protein